MHGTALKAGFGKFVTVLGEWEGIIYLVAVPSTRVILPVNLLFGHVY